ncbi:hypothetical protein [Rhodospirillum sp. A1_3_36]|uniref:hypothetical protein n=1 Tax=Rhodospirillum sp. A1_3_36 TaxID=3391666 RepID=UPI0039A5D6B0
MEKTGSIETFERLFLREDGFMREIGRTPPAKQLQEVRNDLLTETKRVGRSGNLSLILASEKAFLQNDLDRHSTSPSMVSSLRIALTEITAAEAQLEKVRDPEAYKSTDADYSLPKNRIHGLPKDQARQFFSSHATRLLNLDRSRLSPEEKHLLDQRKVNMRAATGLYEALQRDALGLPQKDQGRSRNKGMER